MKREQRNKRPTHGVFVVEGEGDSGFWTKVGAAWAHEDGKGFNVNLVCLPLGGRLVVREPITDTDEGSGR
jgi:hypothetical protein